jgi:hypothetical protein
MSATRNFPEPIKRLLWGRAAGRCQFPGCNKDLTRDPVTRQAGNFADKAHIRAFGSSGPRARAGRTGAQSHVLDNLMLLCGVHHREVDGSSSLYPPTTLERYKREHEARVRRATTWSGLEPTIAVSIRGLIGGVRAPHVPSGSLWPLLQGYGYMPITDEPVDIDLTGLAGDERHREYWWGVERQIRDRLESALGPHGALTGGTHLSLFALAPMPLLMCAGKLLGDTRPITVHPFDRYTGRWGYSGDAPAARFEWTLAPGEPQADVALIVEISVAVDRELVRAACPPGTAEVTFRAETPEYSVFRSPTDLRAFHDAMLACIDAIASKHGTAVRVHVFPAIPAVSAVQFGRLLLPKAHPAMAVYDHVGSSGGWARALQLLERRTRRNTASGQRS